jgi:hypothetical protein
MAKIEVLPEQRWGADAALHSALESIGPEDKVLVLGIITLEDGSTQRVMRSANMTQCEALFEMERRKLELLTEVEG